MGWIESDAEHKDAINRGWLTSDGTVTQAGKTAMMADDDPRDKQSEDSNTDRRR